MPALAVQRATYRTETSEVYNELHIALQRKDQTDERYGRMLVEFRGGDDTELNIPFEFFEAVIPSFIVFVIMLLFFAIMKIVNKVA